MAREHHRPSVQPWCATLLSQDARKPFENAEFEQAVGELVSFARTRPAFVRSEAARLR